MSQFEKQENIKFCQKFGKYTNEMFQMMKQAYGEEALGHSAVFKWHKRFAQRMDGLEDDEHTGRPKTARTELKIQEDAMQMCASHSQMVDEIAAAAAGIGYGSCHKMLYDDLNMFQVTQHSVPHAY
jgi:hypothetical protein